MVPTGTIKMCGSNVLFRCTSCGGFCGRADVAVTRLVPSRGVSQTATLEASGSLLAGVLEIFVAAGCEITKFTVSDFSGAETCATPLQEIRKNRPLRALPALVMVSPVSKRVPQTKAKLIRVIRAAVQCIGLQALVFYRKEHIGTHPVDEIHKRALVSRK